MKSWTQCRPATLEQLRERKTRFSEHYNHCRPHQALDQAIPRTAWELLEHTSATEPIPLEVLGAKASQYRQVRRLRQRDLGRSAVTVSSSGRLLPDEPDQVVEHAADQSVVEVTPANRQVYC